MSRAKRRAQRKSSAVTRLCAQVGVLALLTTGAVVVIQSGPDSVQIGAGAAVAAPGAQQHATDPETDVGPGPLAQATPDQTVAAEHAESTRASAERTAASRSAPRTEPVRISIELDDGAHEVTTTAHTVAQALDELDVVLDPTTILSHDLTAPLRSQMHISVRTPVTRTEMVSETVDFTSEEIPDANLAKGTTITETPGQEGATVTTFLVSEVDGKVVERAQVMTVVQTQPRDEVLRVGTLELPDPTVKVLSPAQARALAKSMVADRGWDSREYTCLEKLWNRESGWRVKAANPSSSAYGIPQSLPGSKMASAGADWRTNAETQITWGFSYIKGRYKTPCGAWGAFQSKGWY